MKPSYAYQARLIASVMNSFSAGRNVLLAAAPAAGKTRISLKILENILKRNPKQKVLILTHGVVFLREQWWEKVRQAGLAGKVGVISADQDADTKVRVFNQSQIILSLPQTLRSIQDRLNEVYLLVVDEAHHRYLAAEVQSLKAALRPKRTLLMTGTPSDFIDSEDFDVHGISLQELLDHGVVEDPLIELIESSYSFGLKDLEHTLELKKQTLLGRDDTYRTLDKALTKLTGRLMASSVPTEAFDWKEAGWGKALKALGKTLVVCRDQKQARDVAEYYESKHLKPILSISDENDGIEEMERFRNSDNPLLIVVHRGVLGFDFSEMRAILDISGTHNVNRLFQMLCRLVRRRQGSIPKKQPKLFLKVTTPELSTLTYFVMSFVVALSDKGFYFTYKTSNFNSVQVPVARKFKRILDQLKSEKFGKVKKDKDGKPRPLPSLPEVLTFKKLKAKTAKGIKHLAYTDFGTVYQFLRQGMTYWNLELTTEVALSCKSRKEFEHRHSGAYQWMCQNAKDTLDRIFPPIYKKWTLETATKRMKLYRSIKEFRKEAQGAYQWMVKHHPEVLQAHFGHHKNPAEREAAYMAVARQCKDRQEFREKHRSKYAYLMQVAARQDELYEVFGDRPEVISDDEAIRIGCTFSSLSSFREAHHGLYKRLKRIDRLKEVKVARRAIRWNDSLLLVTMKEFKKDGKNRASFRIAYPGAIEHIDRLRKHYLLDKVFGPPMNRKPV